MACRKLKRSQSARRLALPAFTLFVVFSVSFYWCGVSLYTGRPHRDILAATPFDSLSTSQRQQDRLFASLAKPSAKRHGRQSSATGIKTDSLGDRKTYLENVAARASPSGAILVAYVDSAFVDMALNFHQTSLQRHNITNFLFISSDYDCCHLLHRAGLPCHMHKLDWSANRASQYGSRDFIRKMNYRTDVILEALESGYTVLHTDTDVVFLRSPFEYLRALACDIAIMIEKPGLYNAGFVFVRPTRDGVAVYRRMRNDAIKHPLMDDQAQLNNAITNLRTSVTVIALPSSLFASGLLYFELPGRVFAAVDGVHTDHYVIHNNWIVSKEAKVYRFKEHLMWVQNDAEYYTSSNRRYLTYDNPPVRPGTMPSVPEQLDALHSALAIGRTLNRTLILPAFHCAGNKMCALNSIIRVAAFDAVFADEYREHVFLRHPMVPKSVKESRSKTFFIFSQAAGGATSHREELQVLTPRNQTSGANSREITTWFQDVEEAVLSFHCLYGAFGSFADKSKQAAFEKRTNAAFKLADYRQYA